MLFGAKKRIIALEKAVEELAEHMGTYVHFYDNGEYDVGDGIYTNGRDAVQVGSAVKAIISHLNLSVGVKATEKEKNE